MIPAVIKKLHEIDERIEKISEEFNNDHAYKMIPNQQDYLSPMKNSQYLKSNEQLSKPDSVAVSLNTLDIIDIYFGENEVPVLQNLEVQHIFQKWLDKTNSSILEIGHSISEVKDESESIEKAYRSLLKKSETELISIDVEDLTQNGVQIRTLLKKVIKDTLELKTRLKSESSSVSLLFEQLKDLTVKLRSVESGGNLLECETLKSLIVQTDAVSKYNYLTRSVFRSYYCSTSSYYASKRD